MEELITLKKYLELNRYKTVNSNFDINNLDPECIFIGDIYTVKYKTKYDYFAPFEEQTYLKLKIKNAILLRVGFDMYINISNIKTKKQLELINKKINMTATIHRTKGVILGSFFKPFAGEQIALNIKPYQKENKYIREKVYQKKLYK